MGASKRHKVCSLEGIIAAMRPNRTYRVGNLARAYGVANGAIRTQLERAVSEGLVDRVKNHGETCYRLSWSEPESQDETPPPYRSLMLDTTLEGYNATLMAFYELNKERK